MSTAMARKPETDTGKAAGASAAQVALARAACDLIDRRAGERVTLAELASALEVSPWHLQRVFKRVTGVSPRDYIDAHRHRIFRDELKRGDGVAQATYGAGYGSSSRVYEKAMRNLGMTPASYAKGGKGAKIVYCITPCPLGLLLVAATARGICFVSLGDRERELEEAVAAEFPAADGLARDDAANAAAVAQLVAYLGGKLPHVDLPLDVRATAFQRRVWQELLAIPCGETRTYSQIAAALGLPQGQRAVGRACATNPVALIVPCHRALRADGGLGGYRWSVERKSALLEREQRVNSR